MYIYLFWEILKIFYVFSKFLNFFLTTRSVFEILLKILSGFLFKFSSILFNTLCSNFFLEFSSRPLHESRDRHSYTGVADAKKFHRETKAITRGVRGKVGAEARDQWCTEEHDATLVKATVKKRLPCRTECRSRQAEDYLNRFCRPKREGVEEETKQRRRGHNELVFIRRAFGEPVATSNIPSRVWERNAPDAIDFLQPSIGIHGARHRN